MENYTIFEILSSKNILCLLDKSKQYLENLFGSDFALMQSYSQNNPHHCYTLLEHTLQTLKSLDSEGLSETECNELQIAALYHDVGKPKVAFEKNGKTVFYNHAVESMRIAKIELEKYDLKDCSVEKILFYIEHHDDFISFKLKSDIKDNKNPYIIPITFENVQKKILETQKMCKTNNAYVPTLRDYELLMRLCVADVKAQRKEVFQDGKLIDSMVAKLKRIDLICRHIKSMR